MVITRRDLLKSGALAVPATVLAGFSSGKYDSSKPLYITEADEDTVKEVLATFKTDFPRGVEISGISDVVTQLCRAGESVTLKELEHGEGYSGQITRPLQYREVKTGWFGKTDYVQEAGHPIDIRILNIHPDNKFGYGGNLTFHDRAGDLSGCLVAIDGELYKEGVFVKNGALGMLGGFLARTEMKVGGLEAKSERMPIECMGDDAGNLFGTSGGGVRIFGNIPTGRHELMFYATDKRGNRSFAITRYEV